MHANSSSKALLILQSLVDPFLVRTGIAGIYIRAYDHKCLAGFLHRHSQFQSPRMHVPLIRLRWKQNNRSSYSRGRSIHTSSTSCVSHKIRHGAQFPLPDMCLSGNYIIAGCQRDTFSYRQQYVRLLQFKWADSPLQRTQTFPFISFHARGYI